MRIFINSRTGNYNLCDSRDISTSTHIAIYEGEERLRSINITTEYEVSENDFEPEEVVSFVDRLIEEQIKDVWFSTSEEEWREFWGFMLVNEDEIAKGQMEYKIECLKKQAKDYYGKYKSAKHNIEVYKDMLLQLTKEVK